MCTELNEHVRATPYLTGQLDKSRADVQLIDLSQQKATKSLTKESRSILVSQSSCKTYR